MHPTVIEHTSRGGWLQQLERSASAGDLRESLRRRYPFLERDALSGIAILGAGPEGKRLAELCESLGIELVGVFDNDATKRGAAVGRCRVVPADALVQLDRSVPVIVASHRVLGATTTLRALGFRVAPFAALQVLQPRTFPPHMFYDGLLEDLHAHRAAYLLLAGSLADAESAKVLERVIGYRLTLDATSLSDVVDWDLYGFSGILRFGEDEVYVDAGAYDGDSVRMFVAHVQGKYHRILAFEPDAATFQRLDRNMRDYPRVHALNCGLHRRKGTLRFSNDGSRAAIISDQGSFSVEVASLDEVLAGERVSFIKMNIEGAEHEALFGAAQSIARWRPKLAISAYHRPGDLWSLPALVRELVPDYRIYFRQHDGGIIETVLYAHC